MVTPAPTTTPDLRAFRVVQRTSSRAEVTAAWVLTIAALVLWTVMLPLEFLSGLTG